MSISPATNKHSGPYKPSGESSTPKELKFGRYPDPKKTDNFTRKDKFNAYYNDARDLTHTPDTSESFGDGNGRLDGSESSNGSLVTYDDADEKNYDRDDSTVASDATSETPSDPPTPERRRLVGNTQSHEAVWPIVALLFLVFLVYKLVRLFGSKSQPTTPDLCDSEESEHKIKIVVGMA